MTWGDDQAVEMFLNERIKYNDIVKVVEATCESHKQDLMLRPSLEVLHPHCIALDRSTSPPPPPPIADYSF